MTHPRLALTMVVLFTPMLHADEVTVGSVLVTLIEESDVPALQPGQIVEISVQEGESIEAGEILARLSNKEATLRVQQAEIELDSARQLAENDVQIRLRRETADVAATELRRAGESQQRHPKSVSATEMDLLRLNASRAVLEIEEAERELDTARQLARLKENELRIAEHQLSEREIVAPISGVVVRITPRKGEWVEPGNIVARIVRLDHLRAEGYLPSDQFRDWMKTARVELRIDLPTNKGVTFDGKMVFVSPEVNPINGHVRFRAEIENVDQRLKPGLSAELTIHSNADHSNAE